MDRRLVILAVGLLPLTLVSQDLPPGVLLLSRIKAHMEEKFGRLPDYTCLETVRRFHKQPNRTAKLTPLDTVQLEILYSRHRDFYASPGESEFQEADAGDFIGSGMIASGLVTLTLHNVLLAPGSLLTYRGGEELDGRKAVRYDFRLNRRESGYVINVVGGKGIVGLQGSIWADPESLEILRMEDRADDIPPFLPVEEATSAVNYKPVRIGDRDELLPQSAELYLRLESGQEGRDFFEFTHCRSFHTESAIHFDTDVIRPVRSPSQENANAAAARLLKVQPNVPALLKVTVRIISPVTEKDNVGSIIEGRISEDVRYKGKIILPRGSPVKGRIRRLERAEDAKGYFIVGLEFTEVQVEGTSMRFYADLLKLEHAPGVEPMLSRLRMTGGIGSTEKITLPDLPGVASFFCYGKTLRLPPEMQMVWRTRGYLR